MAILNDNGTPMNPKHPHEQGALVYVIPDLKLFAILADGTVALSWFHAYVNDMFQIASDASK